MFDKIFSWGKKTNDAATYPAVHFGRYSDNNKTIEKTARWSDADNLFKEKKYQESIDAFFDYLKDDATQNVRVQRNGTEFSFEISQGSKIVRGSADASALRAEVSLARMPQPSVPVMRRLLDQNFSLYYSRYALDGDRLCMRFESNIETANPNKLYYALKELATKADKQDDLLVQDFAALQSLDTDHIEQISETEKEIKYNYFQKWVRETFDYIASLDTEKFSGGIAYLLLSLSFRIDYLICPEGTLLNELEKIPAIYYAKDEKPTTEKNAAMMEAFKKVQQKTKEDFIKNLFRSKSTFAIVAPQQYKAVSDAINSAGQNMIWYRDNNYPLIGQNICEYGLTFCQYSYSLPKPVSDLIQLFMQVNYPDYFTDLGFTDIFYDAVLKKFSSEKIIERINAIQNSWRKKYPALDFKIANLRFDNLLSFGQSFTAGMEHLNFDNK
ncbi:MAG: hypothetical protein ABJA78_01110 [Ferruginibacter sp.]